MGNAFGSGFSGEFGAGFGGNGFENPGFGTSFGGATGFGANAFNAGFAGSLTDSVAGLTGSQKLPHLQNTDSQKQDISANLGALNAAQKSSEKHFGEDMKGLNEFIGVLQIAQINLRKLLKSLDGADAGGNDCAGVQSDIASILESTQFMGVAVFGTQFSAKVGGANREFFIDNPLALMPDLSAVKAYVSDKISESSQLLLDLSEALTTPAQSSFESVDVSKLASMMKR